MNCAGIDTGGSVSVLRRCFGFQQGRVPTDPVDNASVSVLGFMNDLQRQHFHYNVIRVGVDNFTANEFNRIDYAIYRTRLIYRSVGIGVGRVEHYDITAADANGRDDIGSANEATALTQEWTVPNNGLDVFVVDNISANFVGISNIDGPCNKDANERNGVIGGEVNRGDDPFARTFAHEIGHYLGLSHNHGGRPDCPNTTNGCNNLMAQTRCANSCGGGARTAINLTNGQAGTMLGHCSIQSAC